MTASDLLAVGAGLVLTGAGASQVAGSRWQVEQFEAWGFPRGFVTLSGVLQLTAAGLLQARQTRGLGAALASAVMLGAAATHLRHGEVAGIALPVAVGGAAVASAIPRRPWTASSTSATT